MSADRRLRWVWAFGLFMALTLVSLAWTHGRTLEGWQAMATALLLLATLVSAIAAAVVLLTRNRR
ncbi:MAG: hypothetical protein KDI51_08835 [Xanthomonadales bacterium]|nr:hypothetical protein [Xanthomonadales bacterium]